MLVGVLAEEIDDGIEVAYFIFLFNVPMDDEGQIGATEIEHQKKAQGGGGPFCAGAGAGTVKDDREQNQGNGKKEKEPTGLRDAEGGNGPGRVIIREAAIFQVLDKPVFSGGVHQPGEDAGGKSARHDIEPALVEFIHDRFIFHFCGRGGTVSGKITLADTVNTVGKKNGEAPFHKIQKFRGIADGGKIRNMLVKKAIKERGETSPGHQQREHDDDAPKPDEFLLEIGERGIFFAKRLGHGPKDDQGDEDAAIVTAIAKAHEGSRGVVASAAVEITVDLRVASHATPISAAGVHVLQEGDGIHGGVHAITEQAGDKDTKGFLLGQAPLGGKIPML